MFIEPGSGTSYAAATVAGIAALWIAYHGPRYLKRRYPGEQLGKVFRELLMANGVDTDRGWERRRHGTGIVNALKVLKARLPVTPPARPETLSADGTGAARNDLDRISQHFPDNTPAQVEKMLASAFRIEGTELREVLTHCVDELEFHVVTNSEFRKTLASATRNSRIRAHIRLRNQIPDASSTLRAYLGTKERTRKSAGAQADK